jgi:hypothetical protein
VNGCMVDCSVEQGLIAEYLILPVQEHHPKHLALFPPQLCHQELFGIVRGAKGGFPDKLLGYQMLGKADDFILGGWSLGAIKTLAGFAD